MKGRIVWALLAAFLLLAACRRAETPEPAPPPAAADPAPAVDPKSVALEHLSVEVVVDWEDADRVLDSLEELSRLLDGALQERDCTLGEPATITIGTAGGVTAQALADGGVDAAFLPAADLTEGAAAIEVLMNTDQDFILAVGTARAELDEYFRLVLAEALTATEDGQAFLETCYPGMGFAPAAE